MSLTLSKEFDDTNDIYSRIEGRIGGQYPIGMNHCWHSGVHLHNGEHWPKGAPIRPITNGTIVACRLTDLIPIIPRLKKISKEEKGKLSAIEQSLYSENPDDDNNFTLLHEKVDKNTYNDFKEEKREWFRETEKGEYEAIEKVSTEYILIKHEVYLPKYNDKPRTSITFFSLYMGINKLYKELKEKLKEYYKDFYGITNNKTSDIANYMKKIPVYQKWKFRLKYIT